MNSDSLKFLTNCLWIGLIVGLVYWGSSQNYKRYEFHSMNNSPMVYVFDKQTGIVNMLWQGTPQWVQSKWDSTHNLGPSTVWVGKKDE